MSKSYPISGFKDYNPKATFLLNYIVSSLSNIFEKYGYEPIITPSLEPISVLEGKYGHSSEHLIYKILEFDFFHKLKNKLKNFNNLNEQEVLSLISEKGLIYDLTVPLARYVNTHFHEITFPFRRYQIQWVWRGERPQKGRYRQFLQCDIDIVGASSPYADTEIVLVVCHALKKLNLYNYSSILVNHRGILEGLCKFLKINEDDYLNLITIIDKYDKINIDGVLSEASKKINLTNHQLSILEEFFCNSENFLRNYLQEIPTVKTGASICTTIINTVKSINKDAQIILVPYLARGMAYYTDFIFEVQVKDYSLSIIGGGRYNNLIKALGNIDLPAVGASFGIDRIIEVLEKLEIYSPHLPKRVLIVYIGEIKEYQLKVAQILREAGISVEVYPDPHPLKKQLQYAQKNQINVLIFAGQDEEKKGTISLRYLKGGKIHKEEILLSNAKDRILYLLNNL